MTYFISLSDEVMRLRNSIGSNLVDQGSHTVIMKGVVDVVQHTQPILRLLFWRPHTEWQAVDPKTKLCWGNFGNRTITSLCS